MPFEPYTFYVLSAYGLALIALLSLLGNASWAHRKAMEKLQ